MKLYNSYSQTIEELKPIEPGKISMYVCGPTVYNYPHIGNARPIVVFDTLKKALSAQGYEVTFASNYTDVDDKIIKTAIEQNVTEKEITDKFIVAYNDVRKGLHADLPDYAPRVTETMDRIIEFIDKMVKNGSAYQVGGDVYFRVNSDKKYGELSHQSIDDLMVGARIDENEKNVLKIKHIMKNLDRVMIVNEISKEDTYYEKWFSLGNNDASKGNALCFLADYFNIPIKNTIAIGNDYNDISMFNKSGYSVCVANASEEIKNMVDYVTSSNDDDGVAIFLESILKK